MNSFHNIVGKIFLKAVVLVMLALLTIANAILKVFTFIFRFLASPAVVFGFIILVATYLDNGYDVMLIKYAAGLVAAVIFYYLLPMLPPAFDRLKENMRFYVFSPIRVHSPVKFTI